MKHRNWLVALVAFASIIVTACSGSDQEMQHGLVKVSPPSKSQVETVANMRVVFGHQSVGGEILKGMAAIAQQEGVNLVIEETRTGDASIRGMKHFFAGQNEKPETKISDFVAVLSDKGFSGADVAMLKLCYVDIKPDTDGKHLAKEYAAALDLLQSKYPQTRFVAMTAPLETLQTGPKAWIKRLMGKFPYGYESNAIRMQFNEELRSRYDQRHLFDIAKLQAFGGTKPQVFEINGRSNVEALDPALTWDGGHLNEAGQRLVASALINFLAAQPGAGASM